MGVDYSSNYGIGFKVKFDSQEDDFYLGEHLEELLINKPYRYFDVGEGRYTGEDDDFYVVLDSFLPIETLKERTELLKEFLLEKDLIESSQDVDLVGGLLVW